MIIQCDKCSAKFRIDDSKVTPAGVKVRCTKCQNVFMARSEEPQSQTEAPALKGQSPFGLESSSGAPVAGAEGAGQSGEGFDAGFGAGAGEPPSAGPSGEDKGYSIGGEFNMGADAGTQDKPAEEPAPAGFGFGETEQKAEAGAGEGAKGWNVVDEGAARQAEPALQAAPPKREPVSAAPKREPVSEPKPSLQLSAVKKSVGDDASEGASESPESEGAEGAGEGLESELKAGLEEPFGDVSKIGTEPAEGAVPAPKDAGSKKGLMIAVIALVIIIIGGAAALFFDVFSPQKPAHAKTLEISSIEGSVIDNKNIGKLFVIQARIRNVSAAPQTIKGVEGAIYNAAGRKIVNRMVSPGRIVSAEDLKNMTAEDLAKQFKDANGATIQPKVDMPAMIVFTEVPKDLAEYGVDIVR